MLLGFSSVSYFLALLFQFVEPTKLRSWLGSNKFVGGDPASKRANGQMVAELGGNLFVFGGTSGSSNLNDLHIYYPRTKTWVDVSAFVQGDTPSARMSFAFCAALDKLFLFGGRTTQSKPFVAFDAFQH
jgi:N-acetylneuraminic acid mutarotase